MNVVYQVLEDVVHPERGGLLLAAGRVYTRSMILEVVQKYGIDNFKCRVCFGKTPEDAMRVAEVCK